MRQVVLVLFVVDLFLLAVTYFLTDITWLINSQVAFISSSFVMIGSMYSYQGMVNKGIEAKAISDDGRDTLDKLEDPYDLYDEKSEFMEEEKSLEDVVREERSNLKKSRRSFWQTTKETKTSFSFYRLLAYSILVLGFFYLNSNKQLNLTPYLLFLSFPPVLISYVLLKNR